MNAPTTLGYGPVLFSIVVIVVPSWILRRQILSWFCQKPLGAPAQHDAKADRSRFVAQQQEVIDRIANGRVAALEAERLQPRRPPTTTLEAPPSNRDQEGHGMRRSQATTSRPAVIAAADPVVARDLAPDSIPSHRVIAHNAFSRFYTLDLSHPSVRVWVRVLNASGMNPPEDFIRAFCYNKTQPDRVCPYCGIQYMPLPEGQRASTSVVEKLEEERRLSGICSYACFAKTGVSPDDHFGKAAERRGFRRGSVYAASEWDSYDDFNGPKSVPQQRAACRQSGGAG